MGCASASGNLLRQGGRFSPAIWWKIPAQVAGSFQYMHVEETKESLTLGAFLRDKLKLKRADDVLSDFTLAARSEENDPQMVISEVGRLADRGCFSSVE